MQDAPSEMPSFGAAKARRPIWFPVVLGLMVVAFAVVVVLRHRIRAQWFISRLDHVESHVDRLNLLNQISAEMAASDGTLARYSMRTE